MGFQATSAVPVPAILDASKESRGVGLKFYEKLVVDDGLGGGCFVSWELDAIFLGGNESHTQLFQPQGVFGSAYFKEHCQNLAIVYTIPFRSTPFSLKQFPKVEELQLV
jgi:hypothetical protein